MNDTRFSLGVWFSDVGKLAGIRKASTEQSGPEMACVAERRTVGVSGKPSQQSPDFLTFEEATK
jgi:hypothetical protein